MRVLHVLDSLNRGGSETLLLDVCRHARDGGLDLTMVATGGGDLEDDFRRSGVDFVRLQRRLPLDPQVIWHMRRVVKARNIQLVHTHQPVEALHAFFATRGTAAKLALSFHLSAFDAKNSWTLKFLDARLHAKIAVSEDMLRCLRENQVVDTRANFHVVSNGVDPERVQNHDGAALRHGLNVAGDDVLFGMVGNFYPGVRKDHFTVCRALPRVFGELPRARFVFAGARSAEAPEIYDRCVEYCREHNLLDRVHFLGPRADVPRILDALDVFVFSSRLEGMPIALIEAMMCGKPCAVSDIPALLEVTDGGACASVFRTGDYEDLAEKLIVLGRAQTVRAELGARARARALNVYSIRAYLARLNEVYREILNRSA